MILNIVFKLKLLLSTVFNAAFLVKISFATKSAVSLEKLILSLNNTWVNLFSTAVYFCLQEN